MNSNNTNTTTPNGYKKTAIGIIPENWEVKSIDKTVNTISIPHKYQTKDYLNYGKYHIIDQGKKDYVGFSDNENHLIKDVPLVLFGDHTKIVKFINYPFCVGADGTKLLKSDIVENEYLYYLISQAVLKLPDLSYSRHFTELKNIQLPIPPKHEQQKIAEILSTWDDAIANCKTTIISLKDRNKGLAQQLLTGKKRLSGFIEKWEVKSLGVMGNVVNGLTYSPDDVLDSGLLVLRSSNIQDNKLSFKNNVFVSNEIKYNPVYKNDILICVRNGSKDLIGKNIIIPKDIEGFAFGAFMIIYRSDFNQFLIHIFKTNLFYKEVHKNLGATINSINNNDFKKFQFSIPSSVEEQTAIAQVLETANQELKNYEIKLEALQLQKRGLMQQLLTGKTRVNL